MDGMLFPRSQLAYESKVTMGIRMQTMQKMQAAAGGKGRGINGAPTPQQIQAMQRAMPPGMLQQMQRQMRGGGGMQEMMKAMMGGGGGDPAEMEEMQRKVHS